MGNYFITNNAIGRYPIISISKDEYAAIKKSKRILSKFLEIEELYEMLFLNYYELEKDIIITSLDQMLKHSASSYSAFLEIRLTINRRIMNFLTAARSYIMLSKDNIVSCNDNNADCKRKEDERLRKIKDNNNVFFVEELRNHVQHRGLPTHLITIHQGWLDDFSRMEICSTFSIDKSQLANDQKFNKKVLDKMQDKIDIAHLFREYMSEISLMHKSIHEDHRTLIESSRSIIEKHINSYVESGGESTISLCAVHKEKSDTVETTPLFLEWDNARCDLVQKHHTLTNLSKRYITNTRIKR